MDKIEKIDKTGRCKRVVSQIQSLSSLEVDELFKILHKSACEYTTNNNGVFINLSWVSDKTLDTIEKYIEFCHQSSTELEKFETIRSEYKHDITISREQQHLLPTVQPPQPHPPQQSHTDAVSDPSVEPIVPEQQEPPPSAPDDEKRGSRISSTMKFYLLKKKYSKSVTPMVYAEDELTREAFVM
jgi:hypothetical protein